MLKQWLTLYKNTRPEKFWKKLNKQEPAGLLPITQLGENQKN